MLSTADLQVGASYRRGVRNGDASPVLDKRVILPYALRTTEGRWSAFNDFK
jgi:hypothetical protein